MKEFIDEYKHLEKLCNEIYHQQHGITQYITDMEQTPARVSRSISGWNTDLRNLKRLRYIRNALVHETSDDAVDYEPKDVECLKDFYSRILNQQDPLALRRIQNEALAQIKRRTQKNISTNISDRAAKANESNYEDEDREWSLGMFLGVLSAVVIVMLLLVVFGWIGYHIWIGFSL